MRRTMQLFRIQLFNLFPIHEIREPGNRKKRAAVILSIGGTAAALFLCAYNILTAGALARSRGRRVNPRLYGFHIQLRSSVPDNVSRVRNPVRNQGYGSACLPSCKKQRNHWQQVSVDVPDEPVDQHNLYDTGLESSGLQM